MVLNIDDGARREFTDREEPMKVLEEALIAPQRPDEHRIRVWHGFGGLGKTALLNEFHRRITGDNGKQHIKVSVLDFRTSAHRDPMQALLQMRRDFGKVHRTQFPTFDVAFDCLYKREHPGGAVSSEYPDIYGRDESDIVEFLEGLGHAVYGVPWVGLLYKFARRLPERLRKWWEKPDVQQHIADIDRYTAIELREKLPEFLAFDLSRALQTKERPPRFVLMLDTYEALWSETAQRGIYNPRIDDWVRQLVERSPGILVTVFSRDKLRWDEYDPAWDSRMEQHLLGGLSPEDAALFLTRAGVRPDSVRKRIVAAACGLPLYLDLAVTQYERLVRNGSSVKDDDFAETPEGLLYRFLEHLTDAERSELLLASYPDEIDETLFDALADAFPGVVAGVIWLRFNRHSFNTQNGDGSIVIHSLVREGLQKLERRERANHFRRVHLWLFERYDKVAASTDEGDSMGYKNDRGLLAAARHLGEAAPEKFASWLFQSRWQRFYDDERYLALSKVLERVRDEIERPDSSAGTVHAWEVYHHLGHVYQFMGRYQEAKGQYERAVEAYDALDNRDPLVYATILHATADVCRATRDDHRAEELYERALHLYKGEPTRYEQRHAEVLFSVGLIRHAQRLRTEAEQYFQEAQEIYKKLAADRPRDYADFLHRLAFVYFESHLIGEAEAIYRQALEIFENELGRTHPNYADTLVYLSMCLGVHDRTAALKALDEAVSTYLEALGQEHPKFGRALHHQALLWEEAPQTRKDARPQLERACRILRNALGDAHDWTKQAAADLLRLQ